MLLPLMLPADSGAACKDRQERYSMTRTPGASSRSRLIKRAQRDRNHSRRFQESTSLEGIASGRLSHRHHEHHQIERLPLVQLHVSVYELSSKHGSLEYRAVFPTTPEERCAGLRDGSPTFLLPCSARVYLSPHAPTATVLPMRSRFCQMEVFFLQHCRPTLRVSLRCLLCSSPGRKRGFRGMFEEGGGK